MQGHRGKQLLEFYAQDVTDTVNAAFGEVTLLALTLYVHSMACADQILTEGMDDSPKDLDFTDRSSS